MQGDIPSAFHQTEECHTVKFREACNWINLSDALGLEILFSDTEVGHVYTKMKVPKQRGRNRGTFSPTHNVSKYALTLKSLLVVDCPVTVFYVLFIHFYFYHWKSLWSLVHVPMPFTNFTSLLSELHLNT